MSTNEEKQTVWVHINETSHSGAFVWTVYDVTGDKEEIEKSPYFDRYTQTRDGGYIYVSHPLHVWNLDYVDVTYKSDRYTDYVRV